MPAGVVLREGARRSSTATYVPRRNSRSTSAVRSNTASGGRRVFGARNRSQCARPDRSRYRSSQPPRRQLTEAIGPSPQNFPQFPHFAPGRADSGGHARTAPDSKSPGQRPFSGSSRPPCERPRKVLRRRGRRFESCRGTTRADAKAGQRTGELGRYRPARGDSAGTPIADLRRPGHSEAVPSVQIKNVPRKTHAVLRQPAAAAHESLQEYVRHRLIEEANSPTIDEALDRAGGLVAGRSVAHRPAR